MRNINFDRNVKCECYMLPWKRAPVRAPAMQVFAVKIDAFFTCVFDIEIYNAGL